MLPAQNLPVKFLPYEIRLGKHVSYENITLKTFAGFKNLSNSDCSFVWKLDPDTQVNCDAMREVLSLVQKSRLHHELYVGAKEGCFMQGSMYGIGSKLLKRAFGREAARPCHAEDRMVSNFLFRSSNYFWGVDLWPYYFGKYLNRPFKKHCKWLVLHKNATISSKQGLLQKLFKVVSVAVSAPYVVLG